MIKIREAMPEDKDAWNEVANKSPNATYAHTWEWKEIVEKGLENKSICLVAENGNDIIGIFSGFLKYSASNNFLVRNRPILFSPLTTTWDYGGPCLLPDLQNDNVKSMILRMHQNAKRKKAVSIRISPYPTSSLFNVLNELGYRKKPRQTIFIDLKKDEEVLWAELNKKTRNQIRQTQNNLNVKEVGDTKILYNCLMDTAKRTGMELPEKRFYDEVLNQFGSKNMAKIHVVENDGNIIGASLCFYYKKYMVTRYYTALSEHLNDRPYHALIWHAITDAKSRGFETCDLGGIPTDENNGIYKFKMGWGGEIINTDWYVKDLYLAGLRSIKRKISHRA